MGWVSWVIGLVCLVLAGLGPEKCEAAGSTFRFDIHHVFSEPVRDFLGFEGFLPEKQSLEYYRVLAHRDRLIRGRQLAFNGDQPSAPVTFSRGNRTLLIDFLGMLHYANVSVGTPAKWFLVALDTGSDLFWLPCECGNTCLTNLSEHVKSNITFNLYSPNASTTSSMVKCRDANCFQSDLCDSPSGNCPYQIRYLSNGTSSTGVVVEDVLHLVTDDQNLEPVKANITLGCGQVQTGVFQKRAAVNGLFGLGLDDYSVPSILAKTGIAPKSFSMCFGGTDDIVGRINFGDKGTTDQTETQLLRTRSNPTYIVNVTDVSVGRNDTGVNFLALFDSGTSFTHLLEPAYSALTENFAARIADKRRPLDPRFPFEFCYNLAPNDTSIEYPKVKLTLDGDAAFSTLNPLFVARIEGGAFIYCLAVLKSDEFKVNIIGQNFMAGYKIVFDLERMILGWKESDCFGDSSTATNSESPEPAPAPSQRKSDPPTPPPVSTVTPNNASNVTPNNGDSPRLHNPLSFTLLLPLLLILAFL